MQTLSREEQMFESAAFMNELREVQDRLHAKEMERNGDLQLSILMSEVNGQTISQRTQRQS